MKKNVGNYDTMIRAIGSTSIGFWLVGTLQEKPGITFFLPQEKRKALVPFALILWKFFR